MPVYKICISGAGDPAEKGIRFKSGTGPPLCLGTKAAKSHCWYTDQWEGAAGRMIQKSEDLPGKIWMSCVVYRLSEDLGKEKGCPGSVSNWSGVFLLCPGKLNA